MNCKNVSVFLNDINVPENKVTSDEGTTSFDIDRINKSNNINSKRKKSFIRNTNKILKHEEDNKNASEPDVNTKKEDNLHKGPILKYFIEHDFKKNSIQAIEKNLKFKEYLYVHEHDPGGCKTLHCYRDELQALSEEKYQEFVNEFLDLALTEVKTGVPLYSMAVMHNGACHLPDLLEHLALKYPHLVIKRMLMGRSDVETLTMKEYREKVHASYSSGTYRCGPLLQLSMVGRTGEESGAYMGELLQLMQQNYFIKTMMPWGGRSCLEGMPPASSNDGPIIWCRPGEQVVPPMEAVSARGTGKKRGINELRRLQYLPRTGEAREVVVEDRTRCHADQVGGLLHKQATAAVGVLKAIRAGVEEGSGRRVLKEVVCVAAEHFEAIVDRLKLDLLEPPMSQCVTWLDDARLNQLNREGIRTGRVFLREDDVYLIPRNVVHQFKTISAATSVAWHVRLKQYHVPGRCSCGRGEEEKEEEEKEEEEKKEEKVVVEKKEEKEKEEEEVVVVDGGGRGESVMDGVGGGIKRDLDVGVEAKEEEKSARGCTSDEVKTESVEGCSSEAVSERGSADATCQEQADTFVSLVKKKKKI